MQVIVAYSFEKAESGPTNHKVNLKKVPLVDVKFDVGCVDRRLRCSHNIISRLCGWYVGGYLGLDSGVVRESVLCMEI